MNDPGAPSPHHGHDEHATDNTDADALLQEVYDDLRALAARKLASEPPGQTLQATALVHEAWLRIAAGRDARWNDRRHFYAAAAQAMRRILVDNARRKLAVRHGGGWLRVDDPDFNALRAEALGPEGDVEALALALQELARSHPRHTRLVELRFFAGFTLEQAAEAVGVSEPTAKRDWAFARAWLFRRIRDGFNASGPNPDPDPPAPTAAGG